MDINQNYAGNHAQSQVNIAKAVDSSKARNTRGHGNYQPFHHDDQKGFSVNPQILNQILKLLVSLIQLLIGNESPEKEKAPDIEGFDKVFKFDKEAGFQDPAKQEEYKNTLNELYAESPSFKSFIDKSLAEDKVFTLTANQGSQASSHGKSNDGKNFTININENDVVFSPVYDGDAKKVKLEEGSFSIARTLVHEIVHASTGLNELGDTDLTGDFKSKSSELDAFKNFQYADEFKADLERRTGNPLPADFDVTTPERLNILLDTIGTGEVVRITNQVLSESSSHNEDPRASYGTYSSAEWNGSPYIGDFLTDLYNDDLAEDNKHDLLFLKLNL